VALTGIAGRTGNGGRDRPFSCSRSQGMRAFLAARHFAARRSISARWLSGLANCSETKRDDQRVSLCSRSDNRSPSLTVRTGRRIRPGGRCVTPLSSSAIPASPNDACRRDMSIPARSFRFRANTMWYLAWFRAGAPLDACAPHDCFRKEAAENEKWIAASRLVKCES
jgi:hypothetical protein